MAVKRRARKVRASKSRPKAKPKAMPKAAAKQGMTEGQVKGNVFMHGLQEMRQDQSYRDNPGTRF